MADFIGSTSQMAKYVSQSKHQEFIVGTEDNFLYRLSTENPHKQFYSVGVSCVGMNKITLKKVKQALEQRKHQITLPKEIQVKAKRALDKMLKIQ
jgi:quinolinate synthase